MNKISPKLGYYVIALGAVLQVMGLAGDAWTRSDGTREGYVLDDSTVILLLLGMGLIVLGMLLGLVSLAPSLIPEFSTTPRLMPALPLVLLAVVLLGSASFAYQAGGSSSDPGSSSVAAAGEQGSTNCPTGTFWHPDMGHCMPAGTPTVATSTGGAPGATPVCPSGTFWHDQMLHCMILTTGATATGAPICPDGTFWHPTMGHCMALTVGGSTDSGTTPSCPAGTFWHPDMGHCMVLAVETPAPGATPVCPAGTYWHPDMLHCMVITTPLPTATPGGPTPDGSPTATPTCPPGTRWHPPMGHCMQALPTPNGTPQPTPEGTPFPTPMCPPGWTWSSQEGDCVQL